jgi:hypothetical protein
LIAVGRGAATAPKSRPIERFSFGVVGETRISLRYFAQSTAAALGRLLLCRVGVTRLAAFPEPERSAKGDFMTSRIWRASALAGSVALVVLLSTQGAAGQPPASAGSAVSIIPQSILMNTDNPASGPASKLPGMPESASLLLLGSAFAVVARQLRRSV